LQFDRRFRTARRQAALGRVLFDEFCASFAQYCKDLPGLAEFFYFIITDKINFVER